MMHDSSRTAEPVQSHDLAQPLPARLLLSGPARSKVWYASTGLRSRTRACQTFAGGLWR